MNAPIVAIVNMRVTVGDVSCFSIRFADFCIFSVLFSTNSSQEMFIRPVIVLNIHHRCIYFNLYGEYLAIQSSETTNHARKYARNYAPGGGVSLQLVMLEMVYECL